MRMQPSTKFFFAKSEIIAGRKVSGLSCANFIFAPHPSSSIYVFLSYIYETTFDKDPNVPRDCRTADIEFLR